MEIQNDISLKLFNSDPLNTCQDIYHVNLEKYSKSRAIKLLQKEEDGCWMFRFDFITQRYYITIKNGDEYINHRIKYYNQKTEEVSYFNKSNEYKSISIEDYLFVLQRVYKIDLFKQFSLF